MRLHRRLLPKFLKPSSDGSASAGPSRIRGIATSKDLKIAPERRSRGVNTRTSGQPASVKGLTEPF